MPGVEQKPYDGDNQVTVLVESGASGNFFDHKLITQLKYRLLDRVNLTVPRKILTARGSLLDGATKGIEQGFGNDEYGNPHLVPVGILIVSRIGTNLYSIKAAASEGITSIFDIENPVRIGGNEFY